MRTSGERGQHTAEFALLIGLTSLVAVSMQFVARSAMTRGLRHVSDSVLGPTDRFTASPESMTEDDVTLRGMKSVLRWSIPNATSCDASGGMLSDRAPSGVRWRDATGLRPTDTVAVGPTRTTWYKLTCDVQSTTDSSDVQYYTVTIAIGRPVDVTSSQGIDQVSNPTLRFRTTTLDRIVGHTEGSEVQVGAFPDSGKGKK